MPSDQWIHHGNDDVYISWNVSWSILNHTNNHDFPVEIGRSWYITTRRCCFEEKIMRIHCNWRYLYVNARFFKGKSEPPTITLGGTLLGGAHVVRWGVNLNETTSFGDLEHIIKNIQKPNLKPNFEFDHQEIWTSTIFYPFFCFPNTFR